MPIIKTNRVDTFDYSKDSLFEGRVLKVETSTETRNWSDTLDYSDMRSTHCTWALVWMGLSGHRPYDIKCRFVTHLNTATSLEAAYDLLPHEQFAWVDCTNIFSDRYGYSLKASVCENWKQVAFGGPIMWENYLIWEAHNKQLKAVAQQLEVDRLIAVDKHAAEYAAKVAAQQTKDNTLKTIAEGMLPLIPSKGTTVTVEGFTGKIFWSGVSKYRNKWNANAGIKDINGIVKWVPAIKFESYPKI